MDLVIRLTASEEAQLTKASEQAGIDPVEMVSKLIRTHLDGITRSDREVRVSEYTEPGAGDRSTPLRPFGLCRGQFVVPANFDDPLPEQILAEFERP